MCADGPGNHVELDSKTYGVLHGSALFDLCDSSEIGTCFCSVDYFDGITLKPI